VARRIAQYTGRRLETDIHTPTVESAYRVQIETGGQREDVGDAIAKPLIALSWAS
jgi:hypothetical protein